MAFTRSCYEIASGLNNAGRNRFPGWVEFGRAKAPNLTMFPKVRLALLCPLPLRERAARKINEECWVRGAGHKDPSPILFCRCSGIALSRKGRGRSHKRRNFLWHGNAKALPD